MNEIEYLFENTAFVINLVIQLILLIVFFVMAWNISQIRKSVAKSNRAYLLKEAERFEFKGMQKEAVDLYKDYLYWVLHSTYTIEYKKTEMKLIAEKIKFLGGELPEQLKKYGID